jgi:hypothetical protein
VGKKKEEEEKKLNFIKLGCKNVHLEKKKFEIKKKN